LNPDIRREKSAAIRARFWQLKELPAPRIIFAYVNFRSEAETLPLISDCLKKGIRVAVPLTLVEDKKLLPYEIHDPEMDLAPGYCRIPEPLPERTSMIDPREIDTIILPGSAFDRSGGRLGYGGGYYDRFLARDAPQAVRIAFAYDLQVVETLPLEPHDMRLHYLLTESQTIRITEGNQA
jgi:5-formyltetrahydrofolate cyclo-ligase